MRTEINTEIWMKFSSFLSAGNVSQHIYSAMLLLFGLGLELLLVTLVCIYIYIYTCVCVCVCVCVCTSDEVVHIIKHCQKSVLFHKAEYLTLIPQKTSQTNQQLRHYFEFVWQGRDVWVGGERSSCCGICLISRTLVCIVTIIKSTDQEKTLKIFRHFLI